MPSVSKWNKELQSSTPKIKGNHLEMRNKEEAKNESSKHVPWLEEKKKKVSLGNSETHDHASNGFRVLISTTGRIQESPSQKIDTKLLWSK